MQACWEKSTGSHTAGSHTDEQSPVPKKRKQKKMASASCLTRYGFIKLQCLTRYCFIKLQCNKGHFRHSTLYQKVHDTNHAVI